MSEHVEEIRRRFESKCRCYPGTVCDRCAEMEVDMADLFTALAQAEAEIERTNDAYEATRRVLAQAEREREEDQERAARLATWLDEAQAEVERLKAAIAQKNGEPKWSRGFRVIDGKTCEVIEGVIAKADYDILKHAEAALARVRAALEKYADRANYDGSPSAIDMDDGEAARAALKGRG